MALTPGVFAPKDVGEGYSYAYKIDENGNAGVNYYYKGVPISREAFAGFTGQDVKEIENMAAAVVPDTLEIGGKGMRPNTAEEQAKINQGIYYNDVFAQSDTEDTGGTGGTGTEDKIVFFQGKQYNLADPQQRSDFLADRLTFLNADKDQKLLDAQGVYTSEIADIEQQIADTEDEARRFVIDLQRQSEELQEGSALGSVKRSQSFAKLSPLAFQSSQATSEQFARNKLLEGMGDIAEAGQRGVGAEFYGGSGPLAAGSVYGKQVSQLGKEKQRLGEEFNVFARELDTELQELSDELRTDLGEIDISQGFDPFTFQKAAIEKATAPKVDLSQITPFTTFSQAQPTTTPAAGTAVKRTPSFTEGTPLNVFLGSLDLSKGDEEYLRNYLLGA